MYSSAPTRTRPSGSPGRHSSSHVTAVSSEVVSRPSVSSRRSSTPTRVTPDGTSTPAPTSGPSSTNSATGPSSRREPTRRQTRRILRRDDSPARLPAALPRRSSRTASKPPSFSCSTKPGTSIPAISEPGSMRTTATGSSPTSNRSTCRRRAGLRSSPVPNRHARTTSTWNRFDRTAVRRLVVDE